MTNQTSGLEINRLWPSTFLNQPLPDHDAHSRRLAALAGERPAESVFAIEDASVDWLKAHVFHGVIGYLRNTGFERPVPVAASAWFDVQHFSEVRALRNRAGAYLTGLYVATAPPADEDLGTRDDRRPGCITFYDPRTGMNMNSLRLDPYSYYHHTVGLTPGSLLMWPAFVSYFIHPVQSRAPAVRVGFDVRLRAEEGPR